MLSDEQLQARRDAAAQVVGRGWTAFLQAFQAETQRALDRYARLRSLAPTPEPPALALLTEHEHALAEFARLELAGDPSGAREVIDAVTERAGGSR